MATIGLTPGLKTSVLHVRKGMSITPHAAPTTDRPSTRAARESRHAASAAIATSTDTPANTSGSRADTPNSKPLMKLRAGERQRGADHQPDPDQQRAFAQHQSASRHRATRRARPAIRSRARAGSPCRPSRHRRRRSPAAARPRRTPPATPSGIAASPWPRPCVISIVSTRTGTSRIAPANLPCRGRADRQRIGGIGPHHEVERRGRTLVLFVRHEDLRLDRRDWVRACGRP